jgi:hypothetical protein
MRAFNEAGVKQVAGIDGDYVPREQLVCRPGQFTAMDLKQPFDLQRSFDLVVSVEVAEHLPAESAQSFVASLVAHAPRVLFSAAIPRQGGTGHLNEQWPTYWASLFQQHGYRPYDAIRPKLWADQDVAWWYRQNCLLYCSEAAAAGCAELMKLGPAPLGSLSAVHPEQFMALVRENDGLRRQQGELAAFLSSGTPFSVEVLPDGRVNLARKPG